MSELTTADELDYTDGAMIAGRDESASGTKKGLLAGLALYVQAKLFGDMTGQEGKVPTVNATEDGFEWGDGGGGGDASFPSFTGNEGRLLAVNVTEDGVEWVDPPAGSGGTSTAGATAYRTTLLEVPADDPTVIEFDAEEYDNGGYFTLGQPTRLTAITTGWYVVSTYVEAAVLNADLAVVTITRDGTDVISTAYDLGTGEVVQINLLSVVHLEAGSYLEVSIYTETVGLEVSARFSLATFGDAFPDIAGKGGFFLKVNDAEDGVEWIAAGELEGVPEAPSDSTLYGRIDGDWEPVPPIPAPYSVVEVVSDASHDLVAADGNKYLRFTNGGTKTLNVQDEATEPLPANSEFHIRNVGAGLLTITPAGGVTVTPPNGGTLDVPAGGTVTLKRVDEDEFDLMGQVAAA